MSGRVCDCDAFLDNLGVVLQTDKLLVDFPVQLPSAPHLFSHSLSGVQHPVLPKMKLIACSLSGKPWRTEAFAKTLQTSSCQDGGREQRNVITPTLRSGLNMVMRGVKIPFAPLQTN